MAEDNLSHTLSQHCERVNALCRLCGERARRNVKEKYKHIKACRADNLAKDILVLHDVKLLDDIAGQHSEHLCLKCYSRIIRLRNSAKPPSAGTLEIASKQIQKASSVWSHFDSTLLLTECATCRHFEQQKKPGRPRDAKKAFNKRKKTPLHTVTSDSHLHMLSPPRARDSILDLTFTPPSESASTPSKIPKTNGPRLVDMATSPAFKGDTDNTKETTSKSHNSKGVIRPVDQLVAPLSAQEEACMTKLVRVAVSQSKDSTTLRCKTRGQPLIFKKITKPRKRSSVAPSPLKRRRATEINKLRMNVSGDRTEDMDKQHSTELKTMSKARRRIVLKGAGCGEVTLTAMHGAALRPLFGLSLTKYRQLKRFLKTIGIKSASETKEKQQRIKALCGEIIVENRSLVFPNEEEQGEEVRPTPVASVADLPSFVTKLLDEYDKQHRLTWHDGAIPEDEIWIKIGADHGGGSFKVMIQIANLTNANSKFNTFVVKLVECKDSADNLRRLFNPDTDDISALQRLEWRGKRTRLFLFGDYDFFTKTFGLSGAQAIHPCLYCTASKVQIQTPQQFTEDIISERSLSQLQQDHDRYVENGKHKPSAKLFNNVIRKSLLQIDIDHVTPPYLHILLGVVKKHHDLLEKRCHSLDEEIAKSIAVASPNARDCADTSYSFQQHVKQLREKARKKKEIRARQARADTIADPSQKKAAYAKIEALKHDYKQKGVPLPLLSGPVTANLDNTLRANKIHTQAYHGRAFVGNHCNKYLKTEVFENICENVVFKAKEMTNDGALLTKAQHICDTFTALNALFSAIHTRISHQRALTEEDIYETDQCVRSYMSYFRHNFPTIHIIPKQHILEAHCIPWIRRWKIGIALLGEQGGEATHAIVNSLKRRVWGIQCPQQRLKVLMTEQHTVASPLFQSLIPSISGRKKKC